MSVIYEAALFCLLLCWGFCVNAGELPKWELGVGIGSLVQADYLGASESTVFTAPFPFAVYRAPKFIVDREGLKGSLIGGDRWGLGVTFAGAPPIDSDDNTARQGMPDLEALFEVGPNLHWLLASGNNYKLRFELPVRVAFGLESGGFEGVTSNPRWVWRSSAGRWRYNMSLGAIYSNRKYHDRIYSVSSDFVRPDRSSFAATGGYSGARFTAATNWRGKKYRVGAFLSYTNLSGAQNSRSDLLQRNDNLSVGVIMMRMIKASRVKVTR